MAARALLQELAQSTAGVAQAGASVYVFEADGTTPLGQVMYTSLTGGATLTNPLTADTAGRVRAYTATPQRCVVRVGTAGTPYVSEFYPDPAEELLQGGATLRFTEQGTPPADPGAGLATVYVGTDGNLYVLPTGGAAVKLTKSGLIVNADVAAGAGIVASKLAAGGTANRVVGTTDGTTMTLLQIVAAMLAPGAANTALLTNAGATAVAAALIANANIDPAAAIAASKLAAGGTANRVVATADGTTMAMQQVVDAMIATSAAIALSKLAPGSAGLLRSNGTAISAGNTVATADIAANAITHVLYSAAITSGSSSGAGAWPTAVATSGSVVATGGGRVMMLASFGMTHASVVGAVLSVGGQVDGGAVQTLASGQPAVAGSLLPVAAVLDFGAPAAGAHTFNLLMQSNSAGNWSWAGGYILIWELQR